MELTQHRTFHAGISALPEDSFTNSVLEPPTTPETANIFISDSLSSSERPVYPLKNPIATEIHPIHYPYM